MAETHGIGASHGAHERRGKLVLVIGPSGVGKSVVLKELKRRNPHLHFPRSATTRPRRPGEGDELYQFVTEEQFQAFQAQEKFLEVARVHDGAWYGTLLDEIIPYIEEGKIVVREVDVQGFECIRKHPLFVEGPAVRGPERERSRRAGPYTLQSIFILPESTEQLIERIKRRAPISEEELQKRIASMEKELGSAKLCDARVVNREGKLEEAVRAVEEAMKGG